MAIESHTSHIFNPIQIESALICSIHIWVITFAYAVVINTRSIDGQNWYWAFEIPIKRCALPNLCYCFLYLILFGSRERARVLVFFGATSVAPCLHTDQKQIPFELKDFLSFTPALIGCVHVSVCVRACVNVFGQTFIGMPNRKLFEIQTNMNMHKIQCHFHSIYCSVIDKNMRPIVCGAFISSWTKTGNISSLAIQDERYAQEKQKKM